MTIDLGAYKAESLAFHLERARDFASQLDLSSIENDLRRLKGLAPEVRTAVFPTEPGNGTRVIPAERFETKETE